MPPIQQQATPGRKARRPRTIQACNLCRSKKYKCDGNLPCSHCRRHGTDCVFQGAENTSSNGPGYSIGYVKQLERRLEAAEAALRSREVSQLSNGESDPQLQRSRRHPSHKEEDNMGRVDIPPTPSTFLTPKSIDLDRSGGNRSEEMSEGSNDEVMDINVETQRFEFHGQTSSLAFLERLRKVQETSVAPSNGAPTPISQGRGRSFVSDFQNDAFMDQRETPLGSSERLDEEYYPLHAYTFLDTYFKTLHFVHPIIDQACFLERCHDVWRGHASRLTRSFKALYFSVLALGALTRTWTENDINGMGRLEWTRLLFDKAELALGRPGSLNDLEAVQAPFILAQVCQHELNPNLAYTYLGMAIRTAFSTGINRKAIFRDKTFPSDSPTLTVSRTWWGLYSLEIELSFTLGRPDMLGSDIYHNRPAPPIGDNENSIVPAMLGLSQVMREISVVMYLRRTTLTEKLNQAKRLEHDLDEWVAQLPPRIRPFAGGDPPPSGTLRDPYWPKLQMLILRIRYLHVKTVLFYPFFLHVEKIPQGQTPPADLLAAAETCKDAAISMIKLIHWTYRVHHFYRTWWYNTTYVTFGMSVLLAHIAREPYPVRTNSEYLEYVDQSLEVLGAMEECHVARKIGDYAREFVAFLRTDAVISDSGHNDHHSQPTQFTAFPDVNAFLSGYVAEFDMGYSEFNFFDGNFSTLHAGMEDAYGLDTIENYDPNGGMVGFNVNESFNKIPKSDI